MSEPTISWTELIVLMAFGAKDGNAVDETVRGTIHSRSTWQLADDDDVPDYADTVVDHPTLGRLAVREGSVRVMRRGRLVRCERDDGRPTVIFGAESTWLFGNDPPTAVPRNRGSFGFDGQELIDRKPPSRWEGNDFTSLTGPIQAIEFLDRPAWEFELAPPSHKPFPLQVIIDAETGLVLREGNRDFDSVTEWTEFEIDVDLPEALFTWDGLTQSLDEAGADRRAEHERDMAARLAWLEERGLTHIPLPVAPRFMLHEWDDDGSIYASVDVHFQATVIRRAVSDEHWDAADTVNYPHTYRWSDERWDWLIGTSDRPLSDAERHTLEDYLARTT
jgi:hypothetical protein